MDRGPQVRRRLRGGTENGGPAPFHANRVISQAEGSVATEQNTLAQDEKGGGGRAGAREEQDAVRKVDGGSETTGRGDEGQEADGVGQNRASERRRPQDQAAPPDEEITVRKVGHPLRRSQGAAGAEGAHRVAEEGTAVEDRPDSGAVRAGEGRELRLP